MKILIISERVLPFPGGTETRWDEIATRLANRGHEVDFITGRGDITQDKPRPERYPKLEDLNGYKIKRIMDYTEGNLREGTRSVSNCINFGRYAAMYLRKFNHKADVIDINVFPHLHLPVFRLLNDIPYNITWHEVWGNEWRTRDSFGKLGKEVELFNAQLGRSRIAVSKFTAKRLSTLSKLNSNPIYYIPNGVSDEFFELTNISPEAPRILFVGRLTPDKNVDSLLIPSFLEFLKSYPDAELSIVGSGPLDKLIEQKTSTIDAINFYGRVSYDKLLSLYSNSNVFALPSSREGSAIVAREANTVGIPVVTVDFPNNAAAYETIEHGKNGLVCKPNELTDTLIQAYQDRAKLGSTAKSMAQQFKWNKIVDKVEYVYEKLSKLD